MKLLAIAALAAATAAFIAGADNEEAAAAKDAESWLALVDAGRYGESWERASTAFRSAVTKEKWIETVSAVRDQTGKLETRKIAKSQALKDPPNAPAGDYLMLQYSSTFEKKQDATETMVMAREGDKGWRTSGYFIK
jgi:hypothetical protein